eukprot:scaffold5074_cov99-Cylindrotheca_fusiformis.AAC.2
MHEFLHFVATMFFSTYGIFCVSKRVRKTLPVFHLQLKHLALCNVPCHGIMMLQMALAAPFRGTLVTETPVAT